MATYMRLSPLRGIRLGDSAPATSTTNPVLDQLDTLAQALKLSPAYLGFGNADAIKTYLLSVATRLRASRYVPTFRYLPPTDEEFAVRLAQIGGQLPQNSVSVFLRDFKGDQPIEMNTNDAWQAMGDNPDTRYISMAFIPAGFKAAFGACVDGQSCASPGTWGTGWLGRKDKPTWVMLLPPFENNGIIRGYDAAGRGIRYFYVRTLDERTDAQKRLAELAKDVQDVNTTSELINASKEAARNIQEGKEVLKTAIREQGEIEEVQREIATQQAVKDEADLYLAQMEQQRRVQQQMAGMKDNTVLYVGLGLVGMVGIAALMRMRGR